MRKTDYRHTLKRDLDRWADEGLVSANLAETLLASSGEGLSDRSRGAQLLPAMIGLAIALGFLSIIAANWAAIAPGLRIVLVTLLAAAPLVWSLWKNETPRPLAADIAIGISAVLIGGLLVTIGQAYHTGATTEDFLRSWMIGAFVVAALARSPSALFISCLLLLGYFAARIFSGSEDGQPPVPPLLFWPLAAVMSVLAWTNRALASWHPLMIAIIVAVMFLIIHYAWPSLPDDRNQQAKSAWAILTFVSALFFLIAEGLQRARSIWGAATFAGWACLSLCVSLLALVIAFRTSLQAGVFDVAYWAVSLLALLVASALIGYGGLRRLGFYRVFGVLLFIGVAAFVFFSVGGLMQSGFVLIAAGLLLLGLLRFSGPILSRLFGEGQTA